jgi:hypothetical protein
MEMILAMCARFSASTQALGQRLLNGGKVPAQPVNMRVDNSMSFEQGGRDPMLGPVSPFPKSIVTFLPRLR